ncbi:substrate-binding periplasmic protein [Magnetococcus marinus]|uniref:substrate-binding periplasmic protein n=1 Tax=Magnetococcus marinus TaxID=1124597 RepID=UPI00135F16A5|nr:transporter substrate-binding domain-containing protein [Magnetococcus marinus]
MTRFVVGVALLLLFGLGVRMMPLFKVKVGEVTSLLSDTGLEVSFEVCMPLYGPAPDRDDLRVREAVRGRIMQTMRREASVKDPAYWRVSTLDLHGAKGNNRCQVVLAVLTPRPAGLAPVGGRGVDELFEVGRVLRMALHEGSGNVAHLDRTTGRWEGIIPELGRGIARQDRAEGEVLFVEMKSVDALLDAVRFGIADVAEGHIAYTEERDEQFYLSNAYLDTGLMLGSFESEDAQKLVEKRNINNGRIKLVVVKQSLAAELARGRFPRAVIHYVESVEGIPQKVHWLRERFQNPLNRILFLTDEIIALGWHETVPLALNNTPLLTEDHYILATWNAALQAQANHYLQNHPIQESYRIAVRGK